MTIQYLNKLSSQQIQDQILQIIGYSHNVLGFDRFDFSSCLSNFAILLEENVSQTFGDSLKNSIDCLALNYGYMRNITNLHNNDKDSFLLSFLSTHTGIFTCLIFKKNENFEFVLLTKNKNCTIEIYTIDKYKIGVIGAYLGIHDTPINSLNKPKDVLNQYSNRPSVIKFNNTNTYNSPFIDIENALKYVYCGSNFKTLKFHIDDLSIHINYIKNIGRNYPSLANYANNLIDIYSNNELFMNFTIANPKASFDEMTQKLSLIFSTTPNNYLKHIDFGNLSTHFDFFSKLCLDNKLIYFSSAMDNLKPLLDGKANIEYFNDIKNICEKYFPIVSINLSISYAENYLSIADDSFNKGDYINALKYYGKCLTLNPNHAPCYFKRGNGFIELNLLEQANNCFEKAVKLCPNFLNFRYNYAYTLYKLGNNAKALIECDNILSQNPKHDSASKLQKLLSTKTTKLERINKPSGKEKEHKV